MGGNLLVETHDRNHKAPISLGATSEGGELAVEKGSADLRRDGAPAHAAPLSLVACGQ